MSPPTELDLEAGIREAIRCLESTKRRPLLVALYGWPDSGKSYVMDRLKAHFIAQKMYVASAQGAPKRLQFEDMHRLPMDLYLFHCGWVRGNRDAGWLESRAHEDPNVLAQEILGRAQTNDARPRTATGHVCQWHPSSQKIVWRGIK